MGVTLNAPAIHNVLFEDAKDFLKIKKFPILYGTIRFVTRLKNHSRQFHVKSIDYQQYNSECGKNTGQCSEMK